MEIQAGLLDRLTPIRLALCYQGTHLGPAGTADGFGSSVKIIWRGHASLHHCLDKIHRVEKGREGLMPGREEVRKQKLTSTALNFPARTQRPGLLIQRGSRVWGIFISPAGGSTLAANHCAEHTQGPIPIPATSLHLEPNSPAAG